MIGQITEKTEEFLQACKEAGYERVTIFIHDKRVPDSVVIRKGSTGWDADEDGMRLNPDTSLMQFYPNPDITGSCHGFYWGLGTRENPFRVVCGAPEQRGPYPTLQDSNGQPKTGCPKMWEIVHRLGLHYRGAGSGDGHDVETPSLLTAGYYDLSELAVAV